MDEQYGTLMTIADLQERGWNREMMRKLLGRATTFPDRTHGYTRSACIEAEMTQSFRDMVFRRARRAISMAGYHVVEDEARAA